ncbi:SurA N-terminal domain-containing protein [Streptomyces sp. WMMC1477]|uniref:SurA N-terminal domain-containing protein n=1 Tax=Streptomyces sp. WMMC1477 TaxID=3015155 RepID=UPI0022B6A90C|nr:SurA N-terminal domain-containing protein [Streptomyces sp. WMMC1477]MCZ7431618.1 SurA N-terminal domain-containing protein [Streptomyces sp. WMMC1477]
MHRRRSALPLSAAALLLGGVPLLTGCGGETHPGAAAVVDGDRIEVSSVQARAEAVRDAQRSDPNGGQLIQQTGPLPRYTLNYMLRERVVEESARRHGVEITRRDVQEHRAAQEKQRGGPKGLEAFMIQQSIAPEHIDDALRMQLLIDGIAKAIGVGPRTPNADDVMNREFVETARSLDIDVNPRYGEWDVDLVSLIGGTEPWINPARTPQEPA